MAPFTTKLFREAKKLQPVFQFVNYSNGHVFVQKNRSSDRIKIVSLAQIENLQRAGVSGGA